MSRIIDMQNTTEITKLDLNIAEHDIENGALHVLERIRPEWKPDEIKFKLLTDGITNKLVSCCQNGNTEDTVLVRVYGYKTDLLIDRKAETRNIILLHKENLAPSLYATFENGLAYEYVPGVVLTCETVRQPKLYQLVAENMARLHKVREENPKSGAILWKNMEKFYDLVPDIFADPQKQKRSRKELPTKQKLLDEINYLKRKLRDVNSPIVFCHNDLLLANVIYNGDENKVTFIDYEYAGMNYQAFDIGNHFAEFAGVSNMDYSKYPDKTMQYDWLKYYLKVYLGREDVYSDEIEKLYVQVNKFCLCSHLLWGLWALIQAEHSLIDFDYLRFAADHINEYFARRDEFLSL